MAGERTWDDFTYLDQKLRLAAEAYCQSMGQDPNRSMSFRAISPVTGLPEYRTVPMWQTMLPHLRAAVDAYLAG